MLNMDIPLRTSCPWWISVSSHSHLKSEQRKSNLLLWTTLPSTDDKSYYSCAPPPHTKTGIQAQSNRYLNQVQTIQYLVEHGHLIFCAFLYVLAEWLRFQLFGSFLLVQALQHICSVVRTIRYSMCVLSFPWRFLTASCQTVNCMKHVKYSL